jgi:type II secretory ATPase GspE/PulE/Tfp pilus assembly ATPase PilB-like protein
MRPGGGSGSESQRPAIDPGALSIVDQFLDAAIRARASDVHIEPQGDKVLIRLRVDGRLEIWRELGIEMHAQIVSRLKVMASLDISEKRLPQDGRFSIATPQGSRDFRLAVVPLLAGEKAVVRVLMHDLSKLDFRNIGYSERNQRAYEELLGKPHGLLLHCGPTGSGKTTALYAAINHLRTTWRNIQTVEDPVEGRLAGVNQAQVNAEIGLTFARLLRGFLRQDCDVILVGEIRDQETAQLALQASLTGHLVLGTLHTNSAVGAVARLIDMGVPSFFVGTGLIGVVSQRLVRRLCARCRRPYQPSAEFARQYGLSPSQQAFEPGGCHECNNTGYRGRIGIQEVMPADGPLRDAIHRAAPEQELQRIATQQGMVNILLDGLSKALAGYTTIEEVYRAVVSDAQ